MAKNPKAPQLTKQDWAEIYYALMTKAKLIKDGDYGPEDQEGDDEDWVAHLEEVMAKIHNAIDV